MKPKKEVPVKPATPATNMESKIKARKAKPTALTIEGSKAEEASENASQEAYEDQLRQGKYDTETLLAAHDIKNNPDKMKNVKSHIKKHMAAVSSIADLKNFYDAKYGSGKAKK